ncbi:hypothetical protein P5673_002375 [Acropora cervicornis]|uniref:Uncharacterized protein n=1 Tax=Acropora cervicornis TaxID=6130 RepID=A0AAD9VFN4_ACRCE|nr:hypothetical protein P5673_002375 [Acropora cervicornis]
MSSRSADDTTDIRRQKILKETVDFYDEVKCSAQTGLIMQCFYFLFHLCDRIELQNNRIPTVHLDKIKPGLTEEKRKKL